MQSLDEILQSIPPGDQAAWERFWDEYFEDLCARWTPILQRYVNRILDDIQQSEDCVQEAWMRMVAARQSFKWKGVECFRAWMYTIVGNTAKGMARKKKRDPLHKTCAIESAAIEDESNHCEEQVALDMPDQPMSDQALSRLPERQRDVLTLHVVKGLKEVELADRLDLSRDQVSHAKKRGFEGLKDWGALQKWPSDADPVTREVMLYRRVERKTIPQTAKVLEITEAAVRKHETIGKQILNRLRKGDSSQRE